MKKRYDVVMACDEVRGECGHVRHGSFDGLSAATTMEHYSGGLREIPNREGFSSVPDHRKQRKTTWHPKMLRFWSHFPQELQNGWFSDRTNWH